MGAPANYMIQLKKMNGEVFILNAALIEQVQSLPDTTITLLNGKKILVKNTNEEVVRLTTDFFYKVGIQQAYSEQAGENNE